MSEEQLSIHEHPEHFDENEFKKTDIAVADGSGPEGSSSLIDDNLKEELKKIPDKMAFKIGEVAELLGVKTYVLRYWETEFEALRPKKSNQNQRMYTRKDLETVLLVRKLLHRDRFSIEGARKALKNLKAQVKKEKSNEAAVVNFQLMSQELRDILATVRSLKAKLEVGM